jgi:thymidylate kinase
MQTNSALATNKARQVWSISFSGMDGAGKSTQIDALRTHLQEMGLRVQLIAFWNDVATLTLFRESAGHKIFKGDKGVGSPAAPIERRDKNVRSPLMTCIRLGIYLLDALSLRRTVRIAARSNADVVIFDRYMYDELANLPLANPLVRIFVRLLLRCTPRPQVAILLDADPVEARARKPEYPLDFLQLIRGSYLLLSRWVPGMTVIAPMPLDQATEQIRALALSGLPFPISGPDSGSSRPGTANLNEPHTRPAAF